MLQHVRCHTVNALAHDLQNIQNKEPISTST
jgi:hypothetical protein